ncbi:MAG: SUMF1/EgtB/PvdO family nonheme iron enzyme [Microcystaceae cyanobacterium]
MKTCQCLNPDCLQYSPADSQFCQHCGQSLLLRQHYRAIRMLGQGGFGRTFIAIDEDKPSKPTCVIKQFLPQAQGTDNVEKASELFAQEAQHLEILGKHDQIPELMAYFTQDNRQYLVQEYIEGQTITQELETKGAFKEQDIWELLQDMLSILQFVHQNNVIHRDIKPDNLIRRKKDHKIVLVDFGASKFTQANNPTVTGTVIGSAEYTSPEQSIGKPKFCSDLYSLGATCLHLLTHKSPFELYSVDYGEWIWRDFLPNHPVSDKLGRVLDKLVESAVKRRYQSVEEVLTHISIPSQNTPPPSPSSQPIPSPSQLSVSPPTLIQQTSYQTPSQIVTPQIIAPKGVKFRRFSFETVKVSFIPGLLGVNRKVKEHREIKQAKYFTIRFTNYVALEMVAIPSGTFLMGAPITEEGSSKSERPQHWVTIQPFLMSKYPITQAQYQAILGKNPARFRGAKRPVEQVSWYDAVAFCNKLSQKSRLHFRLPSEAQWEYACRAMSFNEGGTTEFPLKSEELGESSPFSCGETLTTDLGNYNGYGVYANSVKGINRQETTEVGQFPPNDFGLYDMHGNVWEWCADYWHNDYEGAPNNGNTWVKPTSNMRVLRSGSWYSYPQNCRSAYRNHDLPAVINYTIGFRVVCMP